MYLREIYAAHFKESPRDFIELLSYLKTNKISNEDLKDTLERLTKTCKTITIEALKVLFASTHKLLTQIRESNSERILRQTELRFEKYDLVICDEFGYVSFDKAGAELLFNYLSLRTGRKATIITTNLGFYRWEEIFGDPILTAALVDRLTHKAHLINMNGDSFRLRETKLMNK